MTKKTKEASTRRRITIDPITRLEGHGKIVDGSQVKNLDTPVRDLVVLSIEK